MTTTAFRAAKSPDDWTSAANERVSGQQEKSVSRPSTLECDEKPRVRRPARSPARRRNEVARSLRLRTPYKAPDHTCALQRNQLAARSAKPVSSQGGPRKTFRPLIIPRSEVPRSLRTYDPRCGLAVSCWLASRAALAGTPHLRGLALAGELAPMARPWV